MALSYFDKAIIFLLPLIVLYLFKDKTVYVSIEYIYSVTIIVIPLLDFGLSGYFFYAYRNSKDHEQIIASFVKTFKRLYLIIGILGISFIAINYLCFEFEKLIIFIVCRILFVMATTFLASYYRLTNRPEKIVQITIVSNFTSLLLVLSYFFFDLNFSLWLLFFGQIIFTIFYFLKCVNEVFLNDGQFHIHQIKTLIKSSIFFSWPTIIQAFILMYIANYGKINILTNMSIEDGVLLSISQRFSMLIFLTHSSLWAFLIKDVFIDKNLLVIRKAILYKYLGFLCAALLFVILVVGVYVIYNVDNLQVVRASIIAALLIGQTFFGCIYAYLELHYGRENKNIIKLYLAIFGAIIFIALLVFLKIDFLERISIAMFVSTFSSLLLSIFVLYKRNYKIID